MSALIIAQLTALGIFAAERSSLSRAVARTQAVDRLATLIRVINAVPQESASAAVKAFRSRRQRFWLSTTPLVPADATQGEDQELSARVKRALGGNETQVRIALRGHVQDAPKEVPSRKFGPRVQALEVSVELPSGTWLNGETFVRLPVAPWTGIWLWPLLASVASSVIAVVFGVRWITRPMVALANAAESIGRGDSAAPLSINGPREVSSTVSAFNLMQHRLTRFLADRMAMLASISHDLRTPITIARLRAEMIDDVEVRKVLVQSLDEMQQITESTLSFVRDEWKSEATRTIDLSSLVDSVAEDLLVTGCRVEVAAHTSLPIRCRPAMLKRALANLMSNAAKFGGSACVSMRLEKSNVHILIDDNGPGLATDQLDKVFEPFARGEPSRNADTGGIGLGLSIARSVIRAHGGDITLRNLDPGLRAEVILPR